MKMPVIHYEGTAYSALPRETVLDCLLRSGASVPYSCKAGACQSCMVRASEGAIPEASQAGLKDTLRAQGYFLACSCVPSEDMRLTPVASDQRVSASISRLDLLNDSVLRVRLRPDVQLDYRPGQFVSLFRGDGLARSYSLASLPEEGELELHVRKVSKGAMSNWLHHEAKVDGAVRLQGPSGNCFYMPGNPEQTLLLAGTGTGLAPLYGIARDALRQGHTGPVWLFHGALDTNGLYLLDELQALQLAHDNFHFVRSVLRGEAVAGTHVGELQQCILAHIPKPQGAKSYLCGDPTLVNSLRRTLFLAGLASKSIYADAFVMSAVPLASR